MLLGRFVVANQFESLLVGKGRRTVKGNCNVQQVYSDGTWLQRCRTYLLHFVLPIVDRIAAVSGLPSMVDFEHQVISDDGVYSIKVQVVHIKAMHAEGHRAPTDSSFRISHER